MQGESGDRAPKAGYVLYAETFDSLPASPVAKCLKIRKDGRRRAETGGEGPYRAEVRVSSLGYSISVSAANR